MDRAAVGEESLIARVGKSAAGFEAAAPRRPGLLKGLVVPDALFDPLSDNEQSLWE